MSKNIFKYLNNFDCLWVDILHSKYGDINFWRDSAPARCSWFFRGLCNSAICIRKFCKIKSVNPTRTSLLWDPWLFDIPIGLKPTYLNMNVDFEQISFTDILDIAQWPSNDINPVISNLDFTTIMNSVSFDPHNVNHWIWMPKASSTKLASAVYHTLNNQSVASDSWVGWNTVWRIPVAPRIKHFIWLCLRGRLSTSAFLFNIKLGPDNPCVFCGLHRETIDHLLYNCNRTRNIWDQLASKLNTSIVFTNGFSSGCWLLDYSHSMHIIAFIAASAWFIWLCRCDTIFRNTSPWFSFIVPRAAAHVEEFSRCNSNLWGRKLLLCNFSSSDNNFLFTHATSNQHRQVSSAGFFFTNVNYEVSLAGCSSRRSSEFSSDTLFAVEAALNAAMELNKPVKHIFCDLQDIIHLLNCTDHVTSWRFDDQINNLKFLLDSWGNPLIHVIPSSWGSPAVGLAMHGLTHHHPNLFLFGKDLPFWIMKSFINFGFRF